MAMEFDLIRPGTKLTANGEGESYEISSSGTRTFMCWIEITDQIEQESVDVSVYGSEDGHAWGKMPLLKMPQRFYRGDTRQMGTCPLGPRRPASHVRFGLPSQRSSCVRPASRYSLKAPIPLRATQTASHFGAPFSDTTFSSRIFCTTCARISLA